MDIAPTYPIYNQGYNPLTKWDEPPSMLLPFGNSMGEQRLFWTCVVESGGNIYRILQEYPMGDYMNWGYRYPWIIHLRLEFSLVNYPFWGTPIYGNTHMRLQNNL